MGDTLGHRRVFGVLVPYFNSVVEPELAALRPPGVTNQTARFTLDANVLDAIVETAARLVTCHPAAILVGLAPESFPGGVALLEQGVEAVSRRTGLPVFTATHATHAALRRLGAVRLGVVTPFDADGNGHVRAALAEGGFTAVRMEGLARPLDAIGHTPLDDVRAAFRAVDGPDVDALVHVGTGLPVVHLLDELERAAAKPVVGCNAALYWQALRETGITDAVAGFGRLLAEH